MICSIRYCLMRNIIVYDGVAEDTWQLLFVCVRPLLYCIITMRMRSFILTLHVNGLHFVCLAIRQANGMFWLIKISLAFFAVGQCEHHLSGGSSIIYYSIQIPGTHKIHPKKETNFIAPQSQIKIKTQRRSLFVAHSRLCVWEFARRVFFLVIWSQRSQSNFLLVNLCDILSHELWENYQHD